MATLVITHLGAGSDFVDQTQGPIYLNDLAVSLTFGATGNSPLTVTRPPGDISRMASLMATAAAGKVSVAVTLSSDEVTSGLALPPNAVGFDDVASVAATATLSADILLRKDLAAGVAGTPDDTIIFAANALPRKLRVVDAWGFVSTAIAATTVALRDQAAGAGASLASLSSAATGRQDATAADGLATPGTLIGLFIRRSDRGVALTFYARIRPEV